MLILVHSATRFKMSLRVEPSVSPTPWPKETEALGTRLDDAGQGERGYVSSKTVSYQNTWQEYIFFSL